MRLIEMISSVGSNHPNSTAPRDPYEFPENLSQKDNGTSRFGYENFLNYR